MGPTVPASYQVKDVKIYNSMLASILTDFSWHGEQGILQLSSETAYIKITKKCQLHTFLGIRCSHYPSDKERLES